MFYSAGYGLGYNEGKAEVETGHHASEAANQIQRECSTKTGDAARECITKIVDAERESQRGESDLAAQWESASWVKWAGVLAGAQLIATALGLYFVKRTLDATWEAVADTSKATEAMDRQNKIAAEAQRPWIAISVEVEDIRATQNVFALKWRVKFKNIGKTAARQVVLRETCFFDGPNAAEKIVEQRDKWNDQPAVANRVLLPGEEAAIPGEITIKKAAIKWADSGTGAEFAFFVAMGAAHYRDGSGDAQLVTFRPFFIAPKLKDEFLPPMIAREMQGMLTGDKIITRNAPGAMTT